MSINALFIFNQKGDILISRLFKDGVKQGISDVFRIQVISNLEVRSPILTLGSTTFLHIKSNDLWIVAVTRANADAGVIFEFLNGFEALLLNYFGGELNEKQLTEHFTTIYDLLDEVLDFGYPQSLDFNSLKQVVPPIVEGKHKNLMVNINKTKKVDSYDWRSSDTPWRKTGIKYKTNEIFLDVYEKLNVLISPEGKIIRSFVDGTIKMKTQLSGMPVCNFGLNDSLSLDKDSFGDALSEYDVKNKKAIPKAAAENVILKDCKFHQCVNLDKFDTDRLIEFIPPDGKFDLMKYVSSDNLNLPFKLSPLIAQSGPNTIELRIILKSLFPSKLNATDITVKVPTHKNTIDVDFSSSGGKAKFSSTEGCFFWTFNKFSGLTQHSLTATIKLAQSNQGFNSWTRPPITLDFNILMFSSSGLVVRFLKVHEKSKYTTIKWLRYISQGGAYEVRY